MSPKLTQEVAAVADATVENEALPTKVVSARDKVRKLTQRLDHMVPDSRAK